MEKSNKKYLHVLLSVSIIIISLVFCIVDYVLDCEIWTHPILNFFFGIFLGFGILFSVRGFIKKSTLVVLIGTIFVSLAVFYLTIQYLPWYIALVCAGCYALCLSIISNSIFGNKTDYADNNSPDYKNYVERAKIAQEQETKENVELPEIKSFK